MTVHLHASLRRRTAHGVVRKVEVDLAAGTTLGDLLARLEIPEHEGILLVVNGRTADPGQGLREGDAVNLIPAVSGG